jgi:hypothetical protein
MEEFLSKQTPQTINAIMWSLAALCVLLLGLSLWYRLKSTQKIKKFRKSLQLGNDIRIASEYGPHGTIVYLSDDEITVLVKITDRNFVKKEDYIFPSKPQE